MLYTVGHGSRTLEEFIALLRQHGIRCLVDIRAYPGSRRHPHFAHVPLAAALQAEGIDYVWMGRELGGFRHGGGAEHTALRSPGFRAYCAHMASEPFRQGVQRLLHLAAAAPTAVMCAERLYWHCHRYFLADALLLRGVRVVHLLTQSELSEHRMNPIARVVQGRLVYDGGQAVLPYEGASDELLPLGRCAG
ncbi:MAG: DUF488 domain-containing protein [Thiobacillaceae bacterium]|nr:DUF488 domain-containing protein [Thiobacillaceae bacterium]